MSTAENYLHASVGINLNQVKPYINTKCKKTLNGYKLLSKLRAIWIEK